jgi:hypothetical protein
VLQRALLLGLAAAATLGAQAPLLRVAFAADAAASGPPALVWLRRDLLALRPEWPAGLRATDAFTLTWRPTGIAIGAGEPLPKGTYLAGGVLAGDGEVLLRCAASGVEDWSVTGTAVPPAILRLAQLFDLLADAPPRAIDVAAAAGNLLPAMLDDDPRRPLFGVGAAECGDLMLEIQRTATGLHLRGRSNGGLLLPVVILWLSSAPTPAELSTTAAPDAPTDEQRWSVRGFTARDGDRPEAARQLARSHSSNGLAALRALLHADDSTRCAAIDSLIRLGAADELPRIVAAGKGQPLATAMAEAAVAELWDRAAPDRRAGIAPPVAGGDDAPSSSRRLLLPLAALFFGLLSFWLRERRRLQRD